MAIKQAKENVALIDDVNHTSIINDDHKASSSDIELIRNVDPDKVRIL
jgi:hypothetical protein